MSKGRLLKQIEISEDAYKMLNIGNVKGLTSNKIIPIDKELTDPYLTSDNNDVRVTNKEEWIQVCNRENKEIYSIYIDGKLMCHATEDMFAYIDFHNLEEI